MVSPAASRSREATRVPSQVKLFAMGIVGLAAVAALSLRNEGGDPFLRRDHEIARRVEEARASEGRYLVKGMDNLRIAVFGESTSWGDGLESRDLAYPHLISPNVDNYAMLSGGPNYPAVCTQSLVGDDKTYDVILLEFFLTADQGLFELVEKLRHRFKHAMIITVKVVGPLQARRRLPSDPGKQMTFAQWQKTMGLGDAPTQQILDALEADDGDWFFPERRNANSMGKELKDKFGIYRATLPPRDTDKERLALYLQWFHEGYTKLKPIGHEILADMIKGTIENKMKFGDVDGLMNKANHLGSWGPGDYCHFWPTKDSFVEDHSSTLQLTPLNRYDDKLAVSVLGPGSFTFTNPFSNARVLYISYLTSTDSYSPPVAAAWIEAAPGAAVLLDPSATVPNRHVRTVPVGAVPPGNSTVALDIVGEPTENPPRIIGATLPDGTTIAPSEFGFAPHLLQRAGTKE